MQVSDKTIYRVLLIVVVSVLLIKGARLFWQNLDEPVRDYDRWYRIGQYVWEDKPLAEPNGAEAVGMRDSQGEMAFFKLPPAFAVYIAPLALLPWPVYVAVYYLLSTAAGAASLFLAVRTVSGKWLPQRAWELVLPVMILLPYAIDDLHNGNNNQIVLLFIMLGAYLAVRGRAWTAGLALGMAVTLKAFPLGILMALIPLRKGKLLAASVVGVLLWTLLVPSLIRGPAAVWTDNVNWAQRIILPYAKGSSQVQWQTKGVSIRNQSLWASVNRFGRKVDTMGEWLDEPDHEPLYVNVASLSAKQAAAVFAGLLAILAGAIGWVQWRSGPATGPLGRSIELSIAMLFVLMASPIVWTYYFTVLVLPAAVAAQLLLRHRRHVVGRISAWVFALSIPLTLLGLWRPARAFGPLNWLALAWLIAMLLLRSRIGQIERPAESEPVADDGLAEMYDDAPETEEEAAEVGALVS